MVPPKETNNAPMNYQTKNLEKFSYGSFVNYNKQTDNKVKLGKQCVNKMRSLARRGTWVAQSVKHPTLAQVMISRFVSSSPASGSVLTARSLEPASD